MYKNLELHGQNTIIYIWNCLVFIHMKNCADTKVMCILKCIISAYHINFDDYITVSNYHEYITVKFHIKYVMTINII